MAESEQYFEGSSVPPKRSSRYVIIFLVILAMIVAAVGAYQYLGTTQNNEEKVSISPTPTEFVFPSDTPTPPTSPTTAITPTKGVTATPTTSITKPTSTPTVKGTSTSTLDKSKLSIEVQNGSGVAGAAKKAADVLAAAGYTISTTGNADNYNYEKTVIQVKSTKADYLNALKTDLSTTYSIDTATADLPPNSTADALVIVGKQ